MHLSFYCVPDGDVSVGIPEDWGVAPYQRLPAAFAAPRDARYLGSDGILSCALSVGGIDWFSFQAPDDTDPRAILPDLYYGPSAAAQRVLRLVTDAPMSVTGTAEARYALFRNERLDVGMFVAELYLLRHANHRGHRWWRTDLFSCAVSVDEYKSRGAIIDAILSTVTCEVTSNLGICFDIGSIPHRNRNYDRTAMQSLLKVLDTAKMVGTQVYSGDVLPAARLWCAKFVSYNVAACNHVRQVLAFAEDTIEGLAPLDNRFLAGLALKDQSLAARGSFGPLGYEGA